MMRILIKATPPRDGLDFNYAYALKGIFHKWTGFDEHLHDTQSFYSFGQLNGGRKVGNQLRFDHGVSWQISFWDIEVAKRAVMGIIRDPDMLQGIRVIEVQECPAPNFGSAYRFNTDSPILVRDKRPDNTKEYLLFDNPRADELLTLSLRRKLEKAGFTGDHLNVQVTFDRTYPKAKPRLIQYKNLKHKGSNCPIWVHGTPETLKFVWLTGLGDLTGSGFGALR